MRSAEWHVRENSVVLLHTVREYPRVQSECPSAHLTPCAPAPTWGNAKDEAKVDVQQVTVAIQHDVPIVAVLALKQVAGDSIPGGLSTLEGGGEMARACRQMIVRSLQYSHKSLSSHPIEPLEAKAHTPTTAPGTGANEVLPSSFMPLGPGRAMLTGKYLSQSTVGELALANRGGPRLRTALGPRSRCQGLPDASNPQLLSTTSLTSWARDLEFGMTSMIPHS